MNEIIERRGPGRPPKIENSLNVSAAPSVSEDTALPKRPARRPFGSMSYKLDYPQREGFHRHWFNDVPGRVSRAQEAGYEHVKSPDGKPVSRIVGTAEGGGALTAFLMEIPEEWYKEDIAKEQTFIDEKEEMMKRGKLNADEKSYVPAQGITIKPGK